MWTTRRHATAKPFMTAWCHAHAAPGTARVGPSGSAGANRWTAAAEIQPSGAVRSWRGS
jgi:hypothetical protein